MTPPVCVPCGKFFKVHTNGVAFEEGHGDGRRRPYKLWAGDLYECEGCHARIIAGIGIRPLAEHFMPEYAATCVRLGDRLIAFVDDCPGTITPRPPGSIIA